jgi:vesicle coat complex subunit
LANQDNIIQILHELKEYTNEVDVEFVRKSIRAIGRCAIKLEKSAEKCVYVLWECLKTKVQYIVYETIIVIRDIFRKYPRKYEAILKDLCDNLKLEDSEAKASMIWIIGEYSETIANADELLTNFAETFKDE